MGPLVGLGVLVWRVVMAWMGPLVLRVEPGHVAPPAPSVVQDDPGKGVAKVVRDPEGSREMEDFRAHLG